MPTFAARRSYRSQIAFAGLAFMLVCGSAAVALAVVYDAARLSPYVAGAGALAYFIATVVAMIPQAVTIKVVDKTVTPSWKSAFEIEGPPELASWVVAGIDAPMGLAVTIRGDRGSLRIGGDKHDSEGYDLRGRPVRKVECHVDKAQLDALLAALGVTRGAIGPLVIPLLRNGQSFGGVIRSMLPWVLAVGVFGLGAVVISSTAVGEQFSKSPEGRLTIAIAGGAIAVIAIAAMVIRSRRVRLPELALRVESDALVVVTTRGGMERRVPWSTVTIEKLSYRVTSRYGSATMPVLALGVGDEKPLRIGAWDATLAWPGEPATTWRGPTWLVGAAKWSRFLDALARHGRG